MRETNELINHACQQIQSLDDFLELGRDCLSPILEITESIPVNSSRYQHYVIPVAISVSQEEPRYLRPINESLFVRDTTEFDLYKNQFQDLIKGLRDSNGNLDSLSQELRQFADGDLIVKLLYTAVQSIGCILDLSPDSQAARKNFGQRFEDFVKVLLSGLGIANDAFTFSVKKPSINTRYNVPIDIIINTHGSLHSSRSQIDSRDTLLSIKTSSKDRMKLIFVDRFVLEKVLEIQRVNYVALYHNDIQRKGKDGISSTFSSDIYMVFCHVFGDLPLYYLDPPAVANEPRFQQKIKTFDTFILHDLWKL
jgi:hypothetical protein